jgi:hypothetical protein
VKASLWFVRTSRGFIVRLINRLDTMHTVRVMSRVQSVYSRDSLLGSGAVRSNSLTSPLATHHLLNLFCFIPFTHVRLVLLSSRWPDPRINHLLNPRSSCRGPSARFTQTSSHAPSAVSTRPAKPRKESAVSCAFPQSILRASVFRRGR